jgi:hypothetical protein
MDSWVSVAYHLPGITWEDFKGMTRTDRALLIRSLNRYLDKVNPNVTNLPSHQSRKL